MYPETVLAFLLLIDAVDHLKQFLLLGKNLFPVFAVIHFRTASQKLRKLADRLKQTRQGQITCNAFQRVSSLKSPVQIVVLKSLVKHIPVIAVPSDNPKGIASLADLANVDLLLIGDPESTPIGKIAKKSLTDAGIWEGLQARGAVTTTTTAPQIASALASGEGDAGIVWKENVKADGATIVDTPDLDSYVKVVPAALLTSVADEAAATAFQDYLGSAAAQETWKKYGYELA